MCVRSVLAHHLDNFRPEHPWRPGRQVRQTKACTATDRGKGNEDRCKEVIQVEKLAYHRDLEHFLERQEEAVGPAYSSDNDEESREDSDCSFVDDNGERAFDRQSSSHLPPRSLQSMYGTEKDSKEKASEFSGGYR